MTKSQKHLNTISNQHQQSQQSTVQYNETLDSVPPTSNPAANNQINPSTNRKSASMESIPSGTASQFKFNNTYSYLNGTQGADPAAGTKNLSNLTSPLVNVPGSVVNVYKKFGTVNGALPSTSLNVNGAVSKQMRPALFGQNFNQNVNDELPGASINGADQLAANNRLRPINRSFRTAVDKSFDMPSNSGKQLNFLYDIQLFRSCYCVLLCMSTY
jgi:hypothetical protein